MEQGDWQNDADYPRAPLPAHERAWRHPSEVGSAQWVQSEPPLVVGRGLSVATGTVGAVLALGLLWLIVPHPGRGAGVALESSTTSVRTVAIATAGTTAADPVTIIDAQPSTLASSSPSIQTITSTDSIDQAIIPTTTSASMATPLPTMSLDLGTSVSESIPPIAVALIPGHFVVTTAAAVRGREGVAVLLPSGITVVGAVVSVDVVNGTAVLSVSADVDDAMIEPSDADVRSGTFVVMTPRPTTAKVWVDDDGTQVGYEGDSAVHSGEGSIVLDDIGRLVGLCTKSANGTQLVTVANLLEALMSATSMDTPAWLGVDYDLDSAGHVVVTRVLTDGPGRAAGIRIGDVISAVDGVPIGDLESLRAAVNSHVAGDMVTLTVSPAASLQTSTTSASTETTIAASTSLPASSTSGVNGSTSATTPTTSVTTTSVRTTVVAPSVDVTIKLAAPPDAP